MGARELVERSRRVLRGRVLHLPRPPALRETALAAVKTGLAAGVAFGVAQAVTGEARPVFAPLTALLAVQVSVRSSVREALPRVVALVLGVVIAVVAGVVVGLTIVSVAVLSLISVLVGRLLRLPASAAAQVPVTALLLVALAGGQVDAAELRVVDGLLGLLTGMAVNAVVAPPLRLRPAVRAADELADALADLLADLAAGLPGPVRTGRARDWLVRARALSPLVEAFADAVVEAEDAHRWNPRGRRTEERVQRLAAASVALGHAAAQVRGVTRVIADATIDGLLRAPAPDAEPPALPAGYGRVCAAAAEAARAFRDVVREDCPLDSDPGRRLVAAVAEATEARQALVEEVLAHGVRREELLLHGSLLADLRRVARELDPERGEHRDVLRPAVPASGPSAPLPTSDRTTRERLLAFLSRRDGAERGEGTDGDDSAGEEPDGRVSSASGPSQDPGRT